MVVYCERIGEWREALVGEKLLCMMCSKVKQNKA